MRVVKSIFIRSAGKASDVAKSFGKCVCIVSLTTLMNAYAAVETDFDSPDISKSHRRPQEQVRLLQQRSILNPNAFGYLNNFQAYDRKYDLRGGRPDAYGPEVYSRLSALSTTHNLLDLSASFHFSGQSDKQQISGLQFNPRAEDMLNAWRRDGAAVDLEVLAFEVPGYRGSKMIMTTETVRQLLTLILHKAR